MWRRTSMAFTTINQIYVQRLLNYRFLHCGFLERDRMESIHLVEVSINENGLFDSDGAATPH